jgi:hypothetical protein
LFPVAFLHSPTAESVLHELALPSLHPFFTSFLELRDRSPLHLLTTGYVGSGRCVSAILTHWNSEKRTNGCSLLPFGIHPPQIPCCTSWRYQLCILSRPFFSSWLTTGYVDSGRCVSAIGTVRIGLTVVPFCPFAFLHSPTADSVLHELARPSLHPISTPFSSCDTVSHLSWIMNQPPRNPKGRIHM